MHLDTHELLNEVEQFLGERKLIFCSHFGSSLYGTDFDTSDIDLRAVFLPTPTEILTGQTEFHLDNKDKKVKLGAGDLDITCYSLQYFLTKISKFDPAAIEMLYASQQDHAVLFKDPASMDWIFNSRHSLVARGNGFMRTAKANLGQLASDSTVYRISFQSLLAAIMGAKDGSSLLSCIDTLEDLRTDPHIDFFALVRGEELDGDKALEVMLMDPLPSHANLYLKIQNKKIDMATKIEDVRRHCGKILAETEVPATAPKEIYQGLRMLDEIIELAADDYLTFPREISPLLRRVKRNEVPMDELRSIISLYYQTAIEAAEDLPFPPERDPEAYLGVIRDLHLRHIEATLPLPLSAVDSF